MKANEVIWGILCFLIAMFLKNILILVVSFYDVNLGFWVDGFISGIAGTLMIVFLLYLKKTKANKKGEDDEV